jgi:3-oxoacyl-[acyl-carrier-protein] synthase II
MHETRIAVTGIGMVSALGVDAAHTFAGLISGASGIAPISLFEVSDLRSKVVGEVRSLPPAEALWPDRAAALSRTDIMAVQAAREAMLQARLPRGTALGVALGGTTGGMFETESVLSSPALKQLSPERATELVSYPLSASLTRVQEAVGGAKVARSVCSACSSGAVALVQGVAWLRSGAVDAVLAGGADGLCRLTVFGFNALGATDPRPCRPFDRERAGLNLGEGSALLLLERAESAEQRGAPVLAWLDGWAVGAEAHHITHPEASGARALELLREALARAGREPGEVSYVNAHGTGTLQNDAMEARALLELLGPGARAFVSSSKSQLGHTLGASGALEAAISVMAAARGAIPPTLGLREPELPGLRHVVDRGLASPVAVAVSSSFGFGGMSCVLVFTRCDVRRELALAKPRAVVIRAALATPELPSPDTALDPERSRRFDRASSLAALCAVQVVERSAARPADTGLVLGSAFGSVERTMAFLARGRDKGPRHVSPAEFPHLVPSAPAGNASIYAGLRGPVLAVSDLSHSAEAAVFTACDLIELGISSQLLAGAISPHDAIVEEVLGPLFDERAAGRARGEAAGLVLLSEADALPGASARAVILGRFSGALSSGGDLAELPAPEPDVRALLVLGATSPELLDSLARSRWHEVERCSAVELSGQSDALGAAALAIAARRLGLHGGSADVARALVLSGSKQRYMALLLGLV